MYAEIARRLGWLVPDRVLDAVSYASMRENVSDWAAQDRVWGDVTAGFGPPSIQFGGTNPLYGKTLGYLTEDVEEPMVFFHLWNGRDDEESWPPEYAEPLLLAVRLGDGPFGDTFTLTSEGRRRRPAPSLFS
ncbi:hypothetical protein [Yinghuangia aomiensis]|uniref:hypothetical protein n=1 Tax=Yinghuangia aomiensis TaxID=676205 RepID=UPI0031F0CC73